MTKVAVILPVHNHLEHTQRSLPYLLELIHEVINHEIIVVVVDDGSTDGTSHWIKTHYPDLILLQGDGSLWWSGAVNLGAKYALENLFSDFIVLWNNDIKANERYFNTLMNTLSGIENDTILGPKIMVAEDPSLIWSMGGYFNPRNGRYGMYGYYEKDTRSFCNIIEVDWLTGMGTVIPGNIIKELGYWNNADFPQYHGDSDFTFRAKKNGYKVIVEPSLILYNSVKSSGIEHNGQFNRLFRLLTDIRSKSNLSKNIRFYRLHATSYRAYYPLLRLYFRIFGGFFKWKVYQFLGINKQQAF